MGSLPWRRAGGTIRRRDRFNLAMPRPLKVFRAHLGFYDTIVAAPSQKAALAAWGSKRDLFRQGFATVTSDAGAVGEALKNPGIVLRRAHGSNDPFRQDPALPKLKAAKKKSKKALAAEKAREEEKRKQAEIAKVSAKLRHQEESAMEKLRRRREALEREEEKVKSLFAHRQSKLKS
jgi:hypothetical protein